MRKFLVLFSLLFFLFSFANAQQGSAGDLEGRVVTVDGEALPGVLVTLSSDVSAKMTAVTNEQGIFRFKRLAPSRNYQVVAELEGFNKAIQKNVQVTIGVTSSLKITLELGQITKEIVIEGKAAVVDSKSTAIAQVMTRQELQSLPTARDPWVILQMAPSIMMDRENVGGSESGQQSGFIGRGVASDDNVWNMDGINITDPSAIGASPTYFDFDAFEEMNVTIGGADVDAQTAGVQLNMVTRRGGNRTSLGGRYYLTDEYFQSENITQEIIDEGVPRTNKIISIKDYGFNVGGPVLKDKIFYWFSVGNQNIHNQLLNGADDKTNLTNYAGKLNVQLIPNNRFEFFYHAGAKTKLGRSAGHTFPEGLGQGGQYHFGSPIFKIQDELTIGDNFFISAKFSHTDAGFKLYPMIDPGFEYMAYYDATDRSYSNSYWNYDVLRPKDTFAASINYFNDSLAGGTHEFKVGFEYTDTHSDTHYDYPGWKSPQINYNYNTAQLDLDDDGLRDIPTGWERLFLPRQYFKSEYLTLLSMFAQDTATYGNWTFKVGVRYDKWSPSMTEFEVAAVVGKNLPRWTETFTSAAVDAMALNIPGVKVPSASPDYAWETLSPRLGITWDINGDGKTIAKASFGIYGGVMSTGHAGNWEPYGAAGSNTYWLKDHNNDGIYSPDEMYWFGSDRKPYNVFDGSGNLIATNDQIQGSKNYTWSGYDFFNNQKLYDPSTNMEFQGSPLTYEALLTLQKEIIKDFGVSVNFTYRIFGNKNWYVDYYPDTGEYIDNPSWYRQAGTVPAAVGGIATGDAAGKPWYVLKDSFVPADYDARVKRDGYSQNFWSVDFVATKRLSNKWMFSGSVTYQAQANQYDDNKGYTNPTNIWTVDGQPFAEESGGASGKIDMFVYSRWMVKLSGLYQLPLDFNVSATFLAREGYIMDHGFTMVDERLPNTHDQDTWVRTKLFGEDRMPTFAKLDLRLEKMIKVSDTMRIYLMADAFNLFNVATHLRRYTYDYGTYYAHNGNFSPNSTSGLLNEVLNPLIFRFGVRFQF